MPLGRFFDLKHEDNGVLKMSLGGGPHSAVLQAVANEAGVGV